MAFRVERAKSKLAMARSLTQAIQRIIKGRRTETTAGRIGPWQARFIAAFGIAVSAREYIFAYSKAVARSLTQVTQRIVQGGRTEITVGRISRWQVMFIAAISIAISACEYVFAYLNVAYGIVIALTLIIGVYLMLSILHLDRRITIISESLTLIPLYILFTSSLPWFFINQQYLLPAIYSCILALCLWHIYRNNLSLKQLFGFSKEKLLKYSLIGLAIGIPMGVGEYFILHPAPAFPTFEIKYLLRDVVYMFLFVGLAEELLFRGLIQQDFTNAFGWKWALFSASVLFAVMHLTWRSIPELGFVFLAGIVLGGLYLKTKSLMAPIVAHGINNVVLVAVAPYIFME